MSGRLKLRVISYDVSDSRRRRRVAGILEKLGTRVQYSVFEVLVTETALKRAIAELEQAIDEGDSIRLYSLDLRSQRQSRILGMAAPIDSALGHWLF